jgi:hypothetical protein
LNSKLEVEVGAQNILKARGGAWGFYTEYREIAHERVRKLHMTFKIHNEVLIQISSEMIEDDILNKLLEIFIENFDNFYSDEPWLLPPVSVENLLLKSKEYGPTILHSSVSEFTL